MIQSVIADKTTTQHAPLERLLTHLRTRKILPFVNNNVVLDFGCGSHLRTLHAIGSKAKSRYGIDGLFQNQPSWHTPSGIGVAGSFADLRKMLDLRGEKVECILSLACFEHFESEQLVQVLDELDKVSSADAIIVGTVPTPPAKPVLEFLSYRLGLIDPTQIADHRVYYDEVLLKKVLSETPWCLAVYQTFQLGMNSFFKLSKQRP